MKKKQKYRELFTGLIMFCIALQFLALPFWLLAGWKWGLSASAIILFFSLKESSGYMSKELEKINKER